MKKTLLPLIIIFSIFILCSFFLFPARASNKNKAAAKTAPKPALIIKTATSTIAATTTDATTSAVAKTAPATVKAKTATAKVVKAKTSTSAKTAVSSGTGVKWASSGLKAVGSLASFDYNRTIRNAYIKKVENYARRNGIKLITAAVVNSMHE